MRATVLLLFVAQFAGAQVTIDASRLNDKPVLEPGPPWSSTGLRQHVVRADLHRTTHASRSGPKASLRTSAESRLLSPGCQCLIPQVL
jgi:hypothetical protein